VTFKRHTLVYLFYLLDLIIEEMRNLWEFFKTFIVHYLRHLL